MPRIPSSSTAVSIYYCKGRAILFKKEEEEEKKEKTKKKRERQRTFFSDTPPTQARIYGYGRISSAWFLQCLVFSTCLGIDKHICFHTGGNNIQRSYAKTGRKNAISDTTTSRLAFKLSARTGFAELAENESELVGVLSPVNHKELYHGWRETEKLDHTQYNAITR